MKSLINIHELIIGYPQKEGNKTLSTPLNLAAKGGNLISLIGANGIGKSTLIKTICGLIPPISGNVSLEEKKVKDINRAQMAQIISLVSTEMHRQARLSVYDVVALGRFPYLNWFGKITSNDQKIVLDAITSVGMSEYVHREVSDLSDGEYQRVMIARALAQDTPIIILDEPTAFLDLPNKYAIVELLWQLTRSKNKLVLFTTHDLNVALQFSDYFWVFSNQNIQAGTPEDLINQNTLEHLFDKRSVFFHKETGQFKLHKNHLKRIGLKGVEQHMSITWMALDRLGYEVICNKSEDITVIISEEGTQTIWTLQQQNKQITCYSIEALQNALRQIN